MRIITNLHWAVVEGDIDRVKELIAARININEKDSKGDTALHYACRGSYRNAKLQIVRILLAAGADVNVENNMGRTPLHEASNTECMEILKAVGADPGNLNTNTDNTQEVINNLTSFREGKKSSGLPLNDLISEGRR